MSAMEITSTDRFQNNATIEASLVIVDWQDLIQSTSEFTATITATTTSIAAPKADNNVAWWMDVLERAYGPTGTGILAIRNVPGFVAAKNDLFSRAHALAHLPSAYLEQHLTDADSLYNAGWSHGKEKLKGDQPDFAKGSFYYNPITDEPGTAQERAQYPVSYPANKWPDETILPGFRTSAIRLGKILFNTVVLLSKHIDTLAESEVPGYTPHYLHNAMKDTEKVKARLLYYFPLDDGVTEGKALDSSEDSWIGWHNDSGFLTALAGDIYIHHATGDVFASDGTSPDPAAGLYIVTRQGCVQHVTIPYDCLAVQIGECAQIVTGGTVIATPHCVRAVATRPDLARISLPCFVDVPPSHALIGPDGSDRDSILAASHASHNKVPPLQDRWTHNGMTFGDFLQRTFQMYYEWDQDVYSK